MRSLCILLETINTLWLDLNLYEKRLIKLAIKFIGILCAEIFKLPKIHSFSKAIILDYKKVISLSISLFKISTISSGIERIINHWLFILKKKLNLLSALLQSYTNIQCNFFDFNETVLNNLDSKYSYTYSEVLEDYKG